MINPKWNFPINAGGQARGIADAGIETFKGNKIPSLARETVQNSLDAADDNKCVYVEIEKHRFSTSDFPGLYDFRKNINEAYEYWKNNSEKAKEFLENAKKELSKVYINVLRISDFNTSGLEGPYDKSLTSKWNQLTKIDGGGMKPSGSNGGFGIGKNAPYANSKLRLVFYRTLNKENEYAAQGIARLLSYPTDIKNQIETTTSGYGYFGDEEYNKPVENINELNKMAKRDRVGTDLFVFGVDDDKNLEKNIIIEILNNFLVSIFNEQLILKIGDVVLDKKHLKSLINTYIKPSNKSDCKTCYSNYMVLTSEKTKEYSLEFHRLGQLKLKVLVDPDLQLDKKILRTRKSGMKLFSKNNISKVINFSAILELEGEKLKEYFKELEPPTHDKWEADRAEKNTAQAELYINEINSWEQSIIWKIGENSDVQEINVEGLNSTFRKDDDSNSDNGDTEIETINHEVEQIEITEISKPTIARGFLQINGNGDKSSSTEKVKGIIDDKNGSLNVIRTLKGVRKRKTKKTHRGNVDDGGLDIINNPINDIKDVALDRLRVIKLKDKIYKIIFNVPYNINKGYIEVLSIGENGKSNKISVDNVFAESNINGLELVDQVIKFDSIGATLKTSFEIEIKDNHNYAMEVKIYEY